MKKKGEKKSGKKSEKKSKNNPSEKKKQRKEEIKQKTIENKAKEKKFIMSSPVVTKLKANGIPMTKIEIRPQKKNTSVQDANKFIDATMIALFNKTKTTNNNNMYQISYKLSNGRWYSSKFINSSNEIFYPNFDQSVGGSGNINVDAEYIEHINILVKTVNPLKK